MREIPKNVELVEVSPRDGIQNEKKILDHAFNAVDTLYEYEAEKAVENPRAYSGIFSSTTSTSYSRS